MKLIAAIILILAGLGLYLLYQKNSIPDLAAEYRYAIDDVGQIHKIKIHYRLMDPDILLERKQHFWLVNGKYRAREDAISNLLSVIRQIELQFIPNAAARQNMIRDLASTGTKVEIFDKQDKLLKSYFIGGVTPDERGTFIIMEGSQSPSVVTQAAIDGSIRPYFIMPEIEWRDRIIFREDPDKIEELTVEYPDQENLSFSLRRQNGDFHVFPLEDDLKIQGRIQKPGAVEAYLQKYRLLGAEALQNDPATIESLLPSVPFVKITLDRSDQSTYAVQLYPVKMDAEATISQRIERYHLLDSEGDLFLVQHQLFRNLFLGIDYFFED